MARFDYDLFVIGGGSGGVRAARVAAQRGLRVAIAEEYRFGGTCVIRGCVPKKLYVYASEYGYAIEDSAGFGWQVDNVSFDWNTLRDNKEKEITRLSGLYSGNLEKRGATALHARAVLTDDHTLEVDGKRVTAETILIATGGRPKRLGVPGCELGITSNEIFDLPTLPGHITIVGGGYIGVEFAHIMKGLGVQVSLVHHRDKVLRGFDDDIRVAVTDGLSAHGIEYISDDEIAHVQKNDNIESESNRRLHLTLRSRGHLDTDVLLSAIGRIPNTDNMGLEACGVRLDKNGAVTVDAYSKTSVDHIYAVGDCTDRVSLTPIAIREAQAFLRTVFDRQPTSVNYDQIPTAVFSQPPAATVGLSEQDACARFERVDIYKTSFRPMKHTLSGRAQRTMMKLVVDADSQTVLGVHMVGLDAAEIIQCMAVAVTMGAKKSDLDATVALHPTTAEEFVLLKTKLTHVRDA